MTASLDIDFGEMPEAPDRWLEGLDRLREVEPVFWSHIQRGWFIARHAEASAGEGFHS